MSDGSERNVFRDLITRVRAGDEEAARELVRLYEPTIRRTVRVRLVDPRLRRLLDSMDVCQSVFGSFFVRAALGQYDLDDPRQLLKLLVSMSRKKLIDYERRERAARRDVRRDRRAAAIKYGLVADEPSPSHEVAARELLHEFRRRLSPEERVLAEQRAQGRDWAGIAAEQAAAPRPSASSSAAPSIASPESSGWTRATMTDAERSTRLLTEQRALWERGEPVAVETYLERHPDLRGDADLLLDLIYNEIYLREQHGQAPRLAEYLDRFPQFAAELRRQFEVHEALPG
jgi:ECF sigma factor